MPLRDIVDIVLKARPQALSFPGANPRHGHEWKVWRDVRLPEGKVIIPGVIEFHLEFRRASELVADRIVQYAGVVGRENVIAGVDCGFGTFAGRLQVDSRIVWMKLASLVEGARLASAAAVVIGYDNPATAFSIIGEIEIFLWLSGLVPGVRTILLQLQNVAEALQVKLRIAGKATSTISTALSTAACAIW